MPKFTYIALDSGGTEMTGWLDATDVRQVAALLRAQGLFPTAVSPTTTGVERKPSSRSFHLPVSRLLSPVSSQELAGFTRQLGTLLKAGMPLLRGLEVLGRQETNPRFRAVLESVAAGIRSGAPLSEALGNHPRIFDRLYLNMVRAGEAGAGLDAVLERLASFQEKSRRLRGKLTAALVYPAVVLLVAVLILCGLLVFVVPKFQQIFADLLKGAPLPPLTQAVLTASELVRHHVLAVAGLVAALGFVGRLFQRTSVGARWIDTVKVRVPLFGDLILRSVIARFSRTLATLLSSGVPLLPALLLTRDTCGNTRVAGALEEVHDRVKAGEPVARPLAATGVFPPMVVSMVEVGEHSGQLAGMLHKVADIYEDEVDSAVAGIGALIEPVLILFLAVVVGTIVIALFLPIIRIVQLLT